MIFILRAGSCAIHKSQLETESQLEKSSRKFLQNFSNWLCCRESCALSKLNWKHQKSIADIKSQISNQILRINSHFCLFLLLISRKRKRNPNGVMQPLDIEHFHQRAMFIKVHLDSVQGLQVQLKGLVPKNKGHKNF